MVALTNANEYCAQCSAHALYCAQCSAHALYCAQCSAHALYCAQCSAHAFIFDSMDETSCMSFVNTISLHGIETCIIPFKGDLKKKLNFSEQ